MNSILTEGLSCNFCSYHGKFAVIFAGCCERGLHAFLIRNLAQGLVLKVPYFSTSFYQILVLKDP